MVSRPAPVNLATDGTWCLAGAVPRAQLIVEPRLLLWMDDCSTSGADINRLSVFWHCGNATQQAGVYHRALCVLWATATPASECTFHQN